LPSVCCARVCSAPDSEAIATTMVLPIAMLMMAALPRSVAPAVPAVHAAPAYALAPCEAAAVPGRTVPAIEIEAITAPVVHVDAHRHRIDETGLDAGHCIDGKASCICLCRTHTSNSRT